MSMQLTKNIPSREKAVKFLWCKTDWMKCSFYVNTRKSLKEKTAPKCYWCNHKFDPDEMMSLAQPEKGKNRLLCRKCADEVTNQQRGRPELLQYWAVEFDDGSGFCALYSNKEDATKAAGENARVLLLREVVESGDEIYSDNM